MNRLCLNLAAGWFAVLVVLAGCQAPRAQPRPAEPSQTAAPAVEDADPLHPRVKIETSVGDIIVELDAAEAPNTVLNFIQYVRNDYYNGTIFHRVLKESMIHGGGYTPDMEPKLLGLKPAVEGTWTSHLRNELHTIALIRGQGKDDLGGAQFYINLVDNTALDESPRRGQSAVFGKVVGGLETIETIRRASVAPHPKYAAGRSAVVPVEPIVIKSVRLLTPFQPVKVQAAAVEQKYREENQVAIRVAELEEENHAKAVRTDSGLYYIDVVVGTGPSPVVTDDVEFHYRGTLLGGTHPGKEFESTYGRDAAVRTVAGLIPGLREGLMTMAEGGRRILIVPPALGFTDKGIPGFVPPDATLVFEIDLLEIR